jgi:hypothetical protein
MKIWWFWRFSTEAFLFMGVTVWFCGAGGYVMNFRKRYVKHKQKRVRSKKYFILLIFLSR